MAHLLVAICGAEDPLSVNTRDRRPHLASPLTVSAMYLLSLFPSANLICTLHLVDFVAHRHVLKQGTRGL